MADKIENAEQFDDSPTGWAERWDVEMKGAEENQKRWIESGEKVVKRFLDNRDDARSEGDTRVNLFTANVQTLRALLYGKKPQVDVKRRFADPGDDVARVAGEILQRLLNTDIERDSDSYATALENSLDDRLLPGLGVIRCRYAAEFEEVEEIPAITHRESGAELAPAYTPEPLKKSEQVDIDYIHWKDFRWSPCRVWDEVRWIAYRAPLTKDQITKRFGEDTAKLVPYNVKTVQRDENDGLKNDPWQRAEVWEIWSKEQRKVFWWVKGYDKVLDTKDDPLELDGFFPSPRPLAANTTTTKFIPKPDFVLAQDLYDEIDTVSSRITLLERAVAVRGVYDKNSEELKRLLNESMTNDLIGIDNFAMFKEKGGLEGAVDWMPLDMVVGALDKLREYRGELMQLLYQVTGMSDIMRGQSSQGATATEQALKAKFASVRVQEFQNEFARFASDAQSLKAEIISKHYSPETIAKMSNVQYMTGTDPQVAAQAIGLIKSDFYQYRIEVKPETVAMADMAAVKQERSEFLMAISTFLQSAGPINEAAPWSMPFLLQMLQWAMAGFRGGATIEGVLDQAVIAARQFQQQKASQPPPPDPKVEQMKMQFQLDSQKTNQEMQIEQQKNQMEVEKQKILTQMEMQMKTLELEVMKMKAGIELQKTQADLQAKEASVNLDARKAEMDIQHEAKSLEFDQAAQQQKHELTLQQMKEKAKAAPKEKEKK